MFQRPLQRIGVGLDGAVALSSAAFAGERDAPGEPVPSTVGPQALEALMVHLARIDLEPQAVRISFIRTKTPRHTIADAEVDLHEAALAVVILPIRARLRGGRTWISGRPGSDGVVRPRRDPTLIKGLQQAHRILA